MTRYNNPSGLRLPDLADKGNYMMNTYSLAMKVQNNKYTWAVLFF